MGSRCPCGNAGEQWSDRDRILPPYTRKCLNKDNVVLNSASTSPNEDISHIRIRDTQSLNQIHFNAEVSEMDMEMLIHNCANSKKISHHMYMKLVCKIKKNRPFSMTNH